MAYVDYEEDLIDVYGPYRKAERIVDQLSDYEKSRKPVTLRSLYHRGNRDIYWNAATISGYKFRKTKLSPHIKRKLRRDIARQIVWTFETLRPVRMIHVIGHEDILEARSTINYGLARADYVAATLRGKIKNLEKKFRGWSLVSWGAKNHKPRGNNKTAAGRAWNRYVDIIISPRHPIGFYRYNLKIF